jgi:O-antigen ligase
MANAVPFDRSALKTNQAAIIALNLLAFVLQLPLLVALVAAVMLAGAFDPALALFQQLYLRALKPAGLVKPRVVMDDPAPHRFAQGLGGAFLALATVALAAGASVVGWALAALVVALALVNLVFDFCVGCQIFFLLARAGFVRRA